MINFPSNPVHGQQYIFNQIKYTYLVIGSTGYWGINRPGSIGVATTADVDEGTNNTKYVSPSSMEGSKYLTRSDETVSGLIWANNRKTSSFTAQPGNGYTVSGSNIIVTLPTTSFDGALIELSDFNGSWNTNNIRVQGNIEGDTELVLDIKGSHIGLIYSTSSNQWEICKGGDGPGPIVNMAAGSGINVAVSGSDYTVSHGNTSNQASVNNTSNNFIQDVTLDESGHVTGLVSSAFNHPDTSSQASLNNSGNSVIQDLTFDSYGHVTGATTKTFPGVVTVSSNGSGYYRVWSDGYIEQWMNIGTVSSSGYSSSNQVVTFPIAFTNVASIVPVSTFKWTYTSGHAPTYHAIVSISTTTMTFNSTVPGRYIYVVGY